MIEIERVGIYVFPDVEELDFVGIFEILAKTRSMKNEGKIQIKTSLQVEILASEDMITCANGLTVKPHAIVGNFEGYDLIIIPGGRGVNKLIKNQELLKSLKDFAKEHIVCSVCTGAFVLGEAGLLKGKKVATHHKAREALKDYCEVVESRVYVDGNVISSGGVSCSLDLGIKILEIIYGKKIAKQVADHLEIPLEIFNNRSTLRYPIKPSPDYRVKQLFQQACKTENMSAKIGDSLSLEENEIRRYILTQAPVLGRLPSLAEINHAFTQITKDNVTTILTKLDQLDVIHLTQDQMAIAAAYPFSGETTPHTVILKEESYNPLYAMCAIDALGVGFMFNCDVVIESRCVHCNGRIDVVIENNEIISLNPDELVVWGDMEYSSCAATSLCKNINFFCSDQHYTEWQKDLPKRRGQLLTIQEAFYLGKMFFENRLTGKASYTSESLLK
ncbi:MAG: organomercurial lyase [Candidatus Hodarchaeota archaeon]